MVACRIAIVIGLSAVCIGCGATTEEIQQQQARQALVQQYRSEDVAAIQHCIDAYPTDAPTVVMPYFRCIIDAQNAAHFRPDDLLMALSYKKLTIAQQYSTGKITHEEYLSLFADADSQYMTQQRERNEEERLVSAREREAKAVACMAASQQNANDRYENSQNGDSGAARLGGAISAFVDTSNEIDACK